MKPILLHMEPKVLIQRGMKNLGLWSAMTEGHNCRIYEQTTIATELGLQLD